MRLDFTEDVTVFDVPDFEDSLTTAAHQTIGARHEAQPADPILVCVVDGLGNRTA